MDKNKSGLSGKHWEVAKLTAITKGYGYTDAGAKKVIEDVGLEKFKSNTYALNPHQPDMGKYSSPEYLESIDD